MTDSPRIKGWRNLTVKGHVSAPLTTQRGRFQQKLRRPVPLTAPGHISAPIITPSKPAWQQRKRRKVEAARLIPAQTLINNYIQKAEGGYCQIPF
jgi:hypothetical protein